LSASGLDQPCQSLESRHEAEVEVGVAHAGREGERGVSSVEVLVYFSVTSVDCRRSVARWGNNDGARCCVDISCGLVNVVVVAVYAVGIGHDDQASSSVETNSVSLVKHAGKFEGSVSSV